ncbi:hypothetical protein, partial [uncultured Nostoc sp.]|uniref:hypothetical protein n=1 Tax=uncultured Nostoc sp. TaxID=340711 RepID=UPI0035CACA52
RWMNESLRWMNESLRWMNESLRWMNESLRWMNESLRWMNESLNLMLQVLRELEKINYPISGIKTMFHPPAKCPLLPYHKSVRVASRRDRIFFYLEVPNFLPSPLFLMTV